MNTTNQQLADMMVRHRLWLLRYEGGATREVIAAFDAYTRELFDELARLERQVSRGEPLTAADRIRVKGILGSLPAAQSATYGEIRQIIDDRLDEIRETEPRAITRMIRTALPEGAADAGVVVAEVPEADALVAIMEPIGGNRWRNKLALDLVEVSETLQSTIASAITQGQSMDDAARMIRRSTDLIETYRGRFVGIARTEIQRVANTAALETYQANKDIVGKVQRLATLDTVTCLVCAPLHNRTYPLDEEGEPVYPPGEGPAPLHQRCRCIDAPVAKSWKELGIDAPDKRQERLLDGNAVEGMTFDDWLRRQPEADQIEVLGASRWQAWSGGDVALGGFSDAGRTLSLGQLRALYPNALPEKS